MIPLKDYLPSQKHEAIPGKVIGVLVSDPQPILSTEGRSGPLDSLCLGANGFSYSWLYVPTEGEAMITNLQVRLADGKIKVYPKLNMASLKSLKGTQVTAPFHLVEIEVNDDQGSPKNDSFVASKVKVLDGSKEFPIKVVDSISEARRKYDRFLEDQAKNIDEAMTNAAKKALKEQKPTGPRETATLMFVTWMASTEKLQIRFLTRITDGAYQYGNGIRIDLPPVQLKEVPAEGGVAPQPKLPEGFRFGTQFGIEMGSEFIFNKDGKFEKQRYLELTPFDKVIPPPALNFRRPVPLPLPPVKR